MSAIDIGTPPSLHMAHADGPGAACQRFARTNFKMTRTWATAVCVLLAAGCGNAGSETPSGSSQVVRTDQTMGQDMREDLELLSRTRIMFGHQSVGSNILEGMSLLAGDHGVPLRILGWKDEGWSTDVAFSHRDLGENGDAKGKIDDFEAIIRNMEGQRPDVAVMKFCYLDIVESTDVPELFEYYREKLDGLRRDFPETVFVHTTVPLTTRRPVRLKEVVYRLRYPEERSVGSAVRRSEFNDLLRTHYGSDPVFDLARAEATLPGGDRVTFEHEGRSYDALGKGYTWDGAHLNEVGKRTMAAEMAKALAGAVRAGADRP